jgi:hypothetical protein
MTKPEQPVAKKAPPRALEARNNNKNDEESFQTKPTADDDWVDRIRSNQMLQQVDIRAYQTPMWRAYLEDDYDDPEQTLLCPESGLPPWLHAETTEAFEERVLKDIKAQAEEEESLKRAWSTVRLASGRKRPRNDESPKDPKHSSVQETSKRGNLRKPGGGRPLLDDILLQAASPTGPLRLSWNKELGLGTQTGTPAYNAFCQTMSQHIGLDPLPRPLTPWQVSQVVDSLQCRTVHPPRDSPWQDFVQSIQSNHEEEEEEEGNPSKQDMFEDSIRSMGHLYQEMCRQDADDGSTFRRRSDHWTATVLKDKLRSMENQIVLGNSREKEVLKRARKKGAVDEETRIEAYRLLGVAPPMNF